MFRTCLIFMKNLLIGYGYWGKKIESVLLNYGELCIFDKNNKISPCLSTALEDLLDDKLIENCFIATPEDTHFELVKECLLKNKNVFVEKPLTLKESEAKKLIDLAKKKKKLLFIDSIFLYDPFFNELKKMVQLGKIGNINKIESIRFSVGFDKKNISVTDDLATHDFYIFEKLLSQKINLKSIKTDLKNNFQEAFANYESENGVQMESIYSWIRKNPQRKMTVYGTEGKIIWDKNFDYLKIEKATGLEKKYIKEELKSPLEKMIDDYFSLRSSKEKFPDLLSHQRYVCMLECLRNECTPF
ncbi:MAG TPA: hypothetical protein DCW58_00455 [Candidatus Pacebacteria bacterium]|nr:hypothetical protein [Candidatus Paceibacterota bacterium]